MDTDWCKHLGASEGMVQWLPNKQPPFPGESYVRKNKLCPEPKRCRSPTKDSSYLGQLLDRRSQSDSLEHLRENDTVDSSLTLCPQQLSRWVWQGTSILTSPLIRILGPRVQTLTPPWGPLCLSKTGNSAQPHMTH